MKSPLNYFGNRQGSAEDCFTMLRAYKDQQGCRFHCFYDLFAGSGSLSLNAMKLDLADSYIVNDLFAPLSHFWSQMQNNHLSLIQSYTKLVAQYQDLPISNRQAFYETLQQEFNQATLAEGDKTHDYAAKFAFIINHAQDGMPLLTNKGTIQLLECKLTSQAGLLNIDKEFSELVLDIHELLKKRKVTFTHQHFFDFKQEILEAKHKHRDFVFLDPPYPDMPDSHEQPSQHIYQRSEPKSQLQENLKQLICGLDQKNIPFMMFYSVLGMEHDFPIYWPQGHVMRLTRTSGPFKDYIEHLFLATCLTTHIPKEQTTIQPCFYQFVEVQAQQGMYKNGDKPALVWEGKDKTTEKLTYFQLNCAANRFAYFLLAQGLERELAIKSLGSEPLVAIYLPRGPALFISILAIMKSGAAFLPIETYQQRFELAAAYQRIVQSKAKFLITSSVLQDTILEKENKSLAKQVKIITFDYDYEHDIMCENLTRSLELKNVQTEKNLNRLIKPDDLTYVMYTSGSTDNKGNGKGVEILQRGLPYAFASHQDLLHIRCDDRIVQFSSIGWDPSIMEMMMAWGSGASLYLINELQYYDTVQLTQYLQRYKISIAILTPLELKKLESNQFLHLRSVLIVGDKFDKSLADAWISTHVNDRLVERQVINGYGLTETTICTTLYLCRKDKELTIGKPILGVEVFLFQSLDKQLEHTDFTQDNYLTWERVQRQHKIIVKSTQLVETAVNIIDSYTTKPGEVYIAGPCIARGYWQRPDLTSTRFKQINIEKRPMQLYKTGDMAYYTSEGNLTFMGRRDRQVKIRGQLIDLNEMGNRIKEHAAVVKDSYVIEYNTQLVVYIVPHDEKLIIHEKIATPKSIHALKQIIQHLRQNVPNSMWPALNHMKFIENVPRKDNAKKTKDEQKMREWSIPCFQFPSDEDCIKDKPDIEKKLLTWLRSLWARVLSLPMETIPYTEYTFADLGGDSLKVNDCVLNLINHATQQTEWRSALERLTTIDVLNTTLINLLETIKNIKKNQQQLAKERQELKKKMINITSESLMFDDDHIYERKVYAKTKINFLLVHSITGNAHLDYQASIFNHVPWYVNFLSTPDAILERFQDSLISTFTEQHDGLNFLIDHYTARISKDNTPVWLFGWSSGGLIAKIIAQQLRQSGKKVYVFMGDTHHPEYLQSLTKTEHTLKLKKMGDNLAKCISNCIAPFNYQVDDKVSVDSAVEQQVKDFFNGFLLQFDDFSKTIKETSSEKINAAKKIIISAYYIYWSEINYHKDFMPTIHPDDFLVIAEDSIKQYGQSLGWTISAKQLLIIKNCHHFNILEQPELEKKITSLIIEHIKEDKQPFYQMVQALEPFYQMVQGLCSPDFAKFTKNMQQLNQKKINPLSYFKSKSEQANILKLQTDFKHRKRAKFIRSAFKNFNPKKLTSLIDLGSAFVELKEYEQAISLFEEIIKVASHCHQAYYQLGIIYLLLENYQTAYEHFTQCIKLHDQHYAAYANRALANFNIHPNPKQALMDLAEAIKIKEKDCQIYTIRSEVKLFYADYEGALLDCLQAIKEPNADRYHLLGKIYFQLDRSQKAIENYNKAINCTSPATMIANRSTRIGIFLQNLGNPIFYYDRGLAQFNLKRYDEAIQDFKKALNINNKNIDALSYKALANMLSTHYKEAVLDFDRILILDAGQYDYYLYRGMAKARLDQYIEAIKDYKIFIEKMPKNAVAYLNMGMAYLNIKQYQQALTAYNKAIDYDPLCYLAYGERGGLKLTLNKFAEAIEDFNKLIAARENINDIELLSRAYRLRAVAKTKFYPDHYTYDDLEEDCKNAIEINPKDPDPYMVRGQFRECEKHFAQALIDYQKALSLGMKDINDKQSIELRANNLEKLLKQQSNEYKVSASRLVSHRIWSKPKAASGESSRSTSKDEEANICKNVFEALLKGTSLS